MIFLKFRKINFTRSLYLISVAYNTVIITVSSFRQTTRRYYHHHHKKYTPNTLRLLLLPYHRYPKQNNHNAVRTTTHRYCDVTIHVQTTTVTCYRNTGCVPITRCADHPITRCKRCNPFIARLLFIIFGILMVCNCQITEYTDIMTIARWNHQIFTNGKFTIIGNNSLVLNCTPTHRFSIFSLIRAKIFGSNKFNNVVEK